MQKKFWIYTISLLVFFTKVSAFEKTVDSERGIYKLHFSTDYNQIPIRQMHTWRVRVSDAQGEAFIPGNIAIDGGMPSHGHGLPSEPKFTHYLGDGELQLDGILFNMLGTWELRVTLIGPVGMDTAILSINLPIAEHVSNRTQLGSNLAQLSLLHLDNLQKPTDNSNRFLTNKIARSLGQRLFFDKKLSATHLVSCASCHQPEKLFTDGRRLSVGSAATKRHAPTLLGVAYSKWFYWDGRRDSLWSQAITPIESKGEMDNDRTAVVHYLLTHKDYSSMLKQLESSINYAELEGIAEHASPYGDSTTKNAWNTLSSEQQHAINTVFAIVGKSLAAFVATLQHQYSRLDLAIDAMKVGKEPKLAQKEREGMKLFLDTSKTDCLRCHNGPLLTNQGFHNVGTGPSPGSAFDYGRMYGLQAVSYDIFNCLGRYSDANDNCSHVIFSLRTKQPYTVNGAFKVPTLRGISKTAPYMHDGRFTTLKGVIEFYRNPPDPKYTPHELRPLRLTDEETNALIAFLRIL